MRSVYIWDGGTGYPAASSLLNQLFKGLRNILGNPVPTSSSIAQWGDSFSWHIHYDLSLPGTGVQVHRYRDSRERR